MPTPLQPELDALAAVLADPARLVRAVGAGRRRNTRPPWRRVELRPVDLRSGPALQVVRRDERQATTSNHPYDGAAQQVVADLLAVPFGSWHVETPDETISLRVTKRGEAQVHRADRTRPSPEEGTPTADRAQEPSPLGVLRAHDRQKRRLLDPGHPFLREVGISDRDGRVKPSRQAKYRQVEDLLRQVAVVLPGGELPGTGAQTGPDAARPDAAGPDAAGPDAARPLDVVDLGCGNAYLTFGAYAYLADVLGREVRLTGVDVRTDSRERNARLAERLGWSDHVGFRAAAIGDVELDERPDVVLALHACDTATDDALVRAVRWQAPVVLAAPCCHNDLQRRLRRAAPPAGHGLVTRHGLLRERLADVLTDAFRAAVLRMLGYRVDVVEFVDSTHTPRNALLRAVRTGAEPSAATVAEYRALCDAWGVTPYLADALAAELAPVLDGAA